MDESRKHQVSLRGASAREISRDALLEKVTHERELRSYARRASASAIFIQRVWRRYSVIKRIALQLQGEWEAVVNGHDGSRSAGWISGTVLRPFLFFVEVLSTRGRKMGTFDRNCMQICFKILLESVNSTDPENNFCSLALGTHEERRTWTYQSRKLISLCSFVLSECDRTLAEGRDIVILASLGMRNLVVLSDFKGWRSIATDCPEDAETVVKELVRFIGNPESGFYRSLRRYIERLEVSNRSQTNKVAQTDDLFLVTASAVTLALRPFHAANSDSNGSVLVEMQFAVMHYCLSLLTIPQLAKRLPAVLLPAVKHKTVLSPCLKIMLILGDDILTEMAKWDSLKVPQSSMVIPPVGWTLANIVCLAASTEKDFTSPGGIFQDTDYVFYVRVVAKLSQNLLSWFTDGGWSEHQDPQVNAETSVKPVKILHENEASQTLITSYVELLKPIFQQWHLKKLLSVTKTAASSASSSPNYSTTLELLDIAYFYSYMLRIFSVINPTGALPVLNMLSFTPGFLFSLWQTLESSLFPGKISVGNDTHNSKASKNTKDMALQKKQKSLNKDRGSKWGNVLNRMTSKPQEGYVAVSTSDGDQVIEEVNDIWNVETLKYGPAKLTKDLSCLLHLFCATYSHMLLVLDDLDFYEKQVPFLLEQQRTIASALNTLVYNSFVNNNCQHNRPLIDSAIRCLHLLYERDCRHQFCPSSLWLSPAKKSRPPIAIAARTHEIMLTNVRSDDAQTSPVLSSVVTVTPHIYPFQERVEMFREFVNRDKVTRRMAGEVTEPGSRGVEIVVRRGHIVEDGFRQLNYLGPRLKSSIHVSFVSESGLPEAGLDYGGLSKEFLTDISKAAFSPEYGLFSQTSTSDRLLVPNPAARYLENGIQMIEFLGRVVGKALYEGILLDYSFAHVFVQKLLGRYSFLDELSTLDQELYRNLMYVKHYNGDVKELLLDFTITEESFGKMHVIELKPGGKDISVTNENKMQYVHAMADYKLNRQILAFSNAFYRGLTDLISPSWLKLFNASEFNQLLSGGDLDIDVDDLRMNTRYSGGYTEGSRPIKLFWEVSCDSSIWASIGGQDVDRLPSASTCYNTLKLPTYKRASTLRAKLLYAITSNTGFELS
ncbi:E3 ubiquitin-protein ligase UPL7 [Linum perenne]